VSAPILKHLTMAEQMDNEELEAKANEQSKTARQRDRLCMNGMRKDKRSFYINGFCQLISALTGSPLGHLSTRGARKAQIYNKNKLTK